MKKRQKMTALFLCAALTLVGFSENKAFTVSAESFGTRTCFAAEKAPEVTAAPTAKSTSEKNELAEKILKKLDTYVYFKLDKSGKYTFITEDEYYNVERIERINNMVTRENYDEVKSIYGDEFFSTYEEYRDYVLGMYGINEELLDIEPAVYCTVRFSDYSETGAEIPAEISAQAKREGVENAVNTFQSNKKLAKLIKTTLDAGSILKAVLSVEYSGRGEVSVTVSASGDKGSFTDDKTYSLELKDGFFLGHVYVPYSTTKLFVTQRSQNAKAWFASYIPDDCLCVTSDTEHRIELGTVDMAVIADKLPHLKELYTYQTQCINTKAISRLKDLEKLTYFAYDGTEEDGLDPGLGDTPFVKLKKLKTIRLYGNYENYSFLAKMPQLKEIHVEVRNPKGAEALFKTGDKRIVSLVMQYHCWGVDLSGISKLKGLKDLTIRTDGDISAIGKLSKLEKLDIDLDSKKPDMSALSGLKNLRDLTIQCCDSKDWSFLKKLKKLRSLEVTYSKLSDKYIEGLAVEDLALISTRGVTFKGIGKLPKLKYLFVTDVGGKLGDLGGSKTLETYTDLLSYETDYSVLAKCPNLKGVYITNFEGKFDASCLSKLKKLDEFYIHRGELLNADKLAKIKSLKWISMWLVYVDDDTKALIRKSLPNCEIDFGDEDDMW